MTDQADTGPIGCLPDDRNNLAFQRDYAAALADEVRALRAENGDLRRQLLNEKQAFAPMHMRVERERLCAELAAARDREAALRSALERTQTNFIDAVRGNPVCGMAENLAENTAALGASVQSEQPTKGASE